MAAILHIFVTLWCAGECFRALQDIRGRFIRLVMFAGLGTIHGFVPAVTPAEWYIAEFSESARVQAAGLALVGVILMSAGWSWVERSKSNFRGLSGGLRAVLETAEGQALLRRLFWLCGLLGVFFWMLGLYAKGLSLADAFTAGRFSDRTGDLGLGDYVAAVSQHLLMVTMVPGYVCFFLPKKYRFVGIAYAVLMALVLFLASRGSRANSMGVLGAVVMGYVTSREVKAYRLAVIGVAGLALGALSISLYDIRHQMSSKTLPEILELMVSRESYQGALTRDPLAYHQFLVAAVEYFPETHPYLNGQTYRRMITFPLPRQFFPTLKPEDPNMVFAAVVNPFSAARLTTIPPTMMGDGYINFWGWPGIVIMLVNGMIFGYVAHKVRSNVLWFVGVGAPMMRLCAVELRGQPYEVLLAGLSGLVFMWMLCRFLRFPFGDAALLSQQVDYAEASGYAAAAPASGRPLPAGVGAAS